MMFSIVLMILCFALDWTKSCKPVIYDYKQIGVKYYGYGVKKGCISDYPVSQDSEEPDDFPVMECSAIQKNADLTQLSEYYDLTDYDDDDLEEFCNSFDTCVWKGGECKAASCPNIASRKECYYYREFKDGKCKKLKGNDCATYYAYMPNPGNGSCYSGAQCPSGWECYSSVCEGRPPCSKLTDYYSDYSLTHRYTTEDKRVCEYRCKHPPKFKDYYFSGPYQYTIPERKYCHKQLGCLYAHNGGESFCSVWSIWAFVLTLVLLIVVVFGVVVFVVARLIRNRKSENEEGKGEKGKRDEGKKEEGKRKEKNRDEGKRENEGTEMSEVKEVEVEIE